MVKATSCLVLVIILLAGGVKGQVKILFDATKAETAGSADWIVDADLWNLNWPSSGGYATGAGYIHSNAQRFPTPAQSGITTSTTESYWKGGLSAWGVDCAKQGYIVETLPCNGQITYGSTTNLQDLTNYNVYIICEPNIKFTTAEKTALMNFVLNGGGLFMISDHNGSDRNGDGWDSPAIWNDFFTSNPVVSNPFGISYDLADFSGISTNVVASSTDSIIHGPMGNVAEVQWANGTSMTLNPAANASVKGVIFKSGTAGGGNTNVLAAYARYGSGRVAAIGDSSPCDDGTGNTDPSITLYDGYYSDAAGNHQKLLMNITIWLAGNAAATVTCAAPTGLAASATTSTSSNLSWSAVSGATGYEYAVDLSASAPTGSGTATTATSCSATGLTAGTTYYLHVRTNCGSGGYSAWSSFSFTTSSSACAAPAGLTASSIMATSAETGWGAVSGAMGYEYVITTSSTPPSGSGAATTAISYSATGLTPATAYYLYVRTNCGAGNYSSWAAFSFTTPGAESVNTYGYPVITVYPNPVSDILHADNTGTFTRYKVSNMTGIKMMEGQLTNGPNSIMLTTLQQGIYLLELLDENGSREIRRISKY